MYFFYFYPLGLDLERRRPPLLTHGLLLVMTVLFIWARYFPWHLPVHPYRLIFFPGNGEPFTVVSAVFLHANWFHFLGNMVYLWVFAPLLEDRLGRWRFLAYFLLLGVAGNIAHGFCSVVNLLGSQGSGVLGASGAIAGLLAFAWVRFSFARVELAYWVFTPLQGVNRAGRAFLPLPVGVILWLLLQLIYGLIAGESSSAVSYGAHLGGFLAGLLLALILGHQREGRAERHLVTGRRFLEAGKAFAAEGAFLEYLALEPDALEGRLLLARARRISGQNTAARGDYLKAFRSSLATGRIDKALEVFAEARRGDRSLVLPARDLARAAFFLEKKLDFKGAVQAYLDLFQYYPTDEQAEFALVRAIVLTRNKVEDEQEARRWLRVAWRELGPGAWREFLSGEFRFSAVPHEGPPEPEPDCGPAPAT